MSAGALSAVVDALRLSTLERVSGRRAGKRSAPAGNPEGYALTCT
ncbi:hypothetical protein BN134_2122 [Cronobacter dublinensis 1210]|uniref:Uncharacterized protein n=1 Tax=Cronobacter dublinensis 1210 TaxID=1208656 RepID=A0ABP1W9Z1_9ENTR|nr:hypothetical protein BN134_2122 [Cronobacter dublinensis 1210]